MSVYGVRNRGSPFDHQQKQSFVDVMRLKGLHALNMPRED